MYKYMAKVVIKILQDSVVTQSALGWLAIYPLVIVHFLITPKFI